ncbi:ATP-binding cassette domain-containing protein [Litoribacter alkaliphilus]|uniref:ATP-binding cassette domain-containing protein n=1 Tax=Litoribacter ruber TaxID=702568 RepID=A0AAP2CDX8_9BACT|nr:ABC transporter ATP-binding protein [Litoribacter alkaliphilus]MBS9522478.1 ATP-binding cassette domain-containing protein [Litoribacter alkaliphilus]
MSNILEVQSLSKYYGDKAALNDVSLDVPKGQVFGLLGPNGAGKTTLIRIINQIIDADSGTILVNGEKLKPSHIKLIGYLPEERGLYKKMKVGEQLLYFAQLKGLSNADAKKKVRSWMDKMEIWEWREKRIEDLSKGMAQKIQFIATVIHQPNLLILDEPFSGFDPVNAELIKNEILELKDKGVSVILSTHRMESVELLCDHIAMINKSRKVLDGSIADIRQQSKTNQYHLKLRGHLADHPSNWQRVEGNFGYEKFLIQLNGHSTNQVLEEAIQFGDILGFEEVIPSIGEIFIQRVKDTDHE